MANQKTIGLGTASLLILALGFLFNFKFADGFMVSHYLFQQLNLSVYSNGETGFHYPFAAAIIFWLSAVLLARKFSQDYGAAISYKIGRFLLILSSVLSIVLLL